METIALPKKFQIVIPKKTRENLGFEPGQKLVLIEKGNIIEPAKTGGIKPAMGIAKGVSAKFLTGPNSKIYLSSLLAPGVIAR